ncbi:MAG: hypothetical protein KJ838_01765, partial [Candidatus Omnitrophica bacterium]|nr:hypothetical protein [Candidatus Omnitrophota bacterium]
MEKEANLLFLIEQLKRGVDLSGEDAACAMKIIMSADAEQSQKAAFLTALAKKGATGEEIASFALTIRQMAR